MYFSHSQRVLLLCLIYESVFVHIVFPYLTSSIQADPKLKKKFGLTRRACSDACRSETEFECKYYKYVDNNGICLISGDDMEVIKKYTSKSIERALFKEISNLKESIDKLYRKYSYLDEISDSIAELKVKANKESKSLLMTGKQFKETVMRQELSVAALDRKVKELEFKENQGKADFATVKAQIHQFLRQLAGMKNLFDIISLEVKDSSSELTSLSLQVKNLKKSAENLRMLILNRKEECKPSCNGDVHEQETKGDENTVTSWTPTEDNPELQGLVLTVDELKEEMEEVKSAITEMNSNFSEVMTQGKNHFHPQNESHVSDTGLKLKTIESRLNYSRQSLSELKNTQREFGNMLTQQSLKFKTCSDKMVSLSEAYKDSVREIGDLRSTLKSFKKELDGLKDLNTHSKMKNLETEQEKIKLRLKSVEDSRNSHENQIARLKDKVTDMKAVRINCTSCNEEERFKSEIKRAQNLFRNNRLGAKGNVPSSTAKPSNTFHININRSSPNFIELQSKKKNGNIPHTIVRMDMINPPEVTFKNQGAKKEAASSSNYHAFLKPSFSATAKPNVKPVKFCPENWFKSVRRCLHYMPRRVSWKGAVSDCQNIDARVASLFSLEEWTDMKIFLAIYSDLNIPLWLSKDSIASLNPKEFKAHMIMPFNSKDLSRKYDENCLVLDPSNNFKLSLVSCNSNNRYGTICELPLSTHENRNPVNVTIHIRMINENPSNAMSENTLPSHWKNSSMHSQICPAFAKEIGGYCFKYIPVKQSNKRAIETCKRLGANLVTVKDLQKELMLENFLVTIGTPNTVWLSPTFLDNDGLWKWASTNEAVVYTNYFPGRPDTLRKTRCNQIKKAWGFKWLDKYCWNSKKSVEHSFICEFKSSRTN
ncbi:uncharacterized protein LOC106869996 [Octopus bimaculoides]|uniref:uncharacterized protein LOC106869996 n=1 Tax=Octopus bimaculoides TaxID=37653 RepID=UPI00071E08F9|nr:uncharacterized protein LOC106869996 [Octopus bimaculoides]|eukprot:XP_014771436.1 PREDICTED: uncharacterized protein LOC106869996 [Octopus bimaculoides]